MEIVVIIILTWFLIGSLATNMMWIKRDLENGSTNTEDDYVRGLTGGTIAGPFTLIYVIYRAIKDELKS